MKLVKYLALLFLFPSLAQAQCGITDAKVVDFFQWFKE